ncbi:hypothetical protein Nepgr_017207 [Nepenthes gracilis]|uniref:Uncharacterized protein n=1 Tax=Nepenthes gracilis TaxID=150966 RepID=A0AAD3SS49_NEPGR|nr:hypothetical protein Nepgr_017207 [Nepenthes gracilis]
MLYKVASKGRKICREAAKGGAIMPFQGGGAGHCIGTRSLSYAAYHMTPYRTPITLPRNGGNLWYRQFDDEVRRQSPRFNPSLGQTNGTVQFPSQPH